MRGDREKYPLGVPVLLFLAAIAAGAVLWLIVQWVVAHSVYGHPDYVRRASPLTVGS